MGVPKFFRYISERYPCLSEVAREQCIPEFDNLYLDMNGIIHNCSHPDDNNIHFNITEEDMFKDIFNYIDKLFFLIKPQKLFFMSVDGVAPRAKMNQQRSRRFRSAKEAELLELKAKNRGEKIEHERFDSNCITPGTEFMSRLHEALRYFIKSKISTDPMWQKCRIILSGHDCPGEGEHKIMDYIRYLKSRSDYDLNTRHCMYGLDADLIILGLCTHEPHFVILREEVKFGRKTKKTSVEETRFFLLHLGLLREYLEMEFYDLRMKDNNFDISKIIDDWILMGFLVGNDFIPHLPCLHISSNALPLLYKTYIKVYPKLCGNINENGKLNLDRLEQYLTALSEVEFELFQENYADLKYFEAKQSKNGVDEAFDFDTNEISKENVDTDLSAFIESSRQFFEDDDDNLSDENQHIVDEFETYKRDYYLKKLNQNEMSSEQKKKQAVCYITALQWILDYYYRGVQSWEWYYPHHYAPFISDLKNFKDIKIEFSMGKPFLPFEQLLAVLPAASKQLLPPAYRHLMTSSNSELIHFYPSNFETDLNGKKHEWEAVVLIPFIDQHLLLDAIKSCDSNLTPSELKRNKHGPMLQFDYNTESQGTTPGIYSLKTLYNVFCTEKPIWSKDIVVPNNAIIKSIENSYARTKFFPGFPTMKHLEYDFQIKFARVKVFDQPSRNENLILLPKKRPDFNDVVRVSEKFLNQVVYIGWPHLIKAQVIGISSKDKYISSNGIEDMDPKLFQHQFKTAQEHLTTRMGIEFSDFSVMVHVKTHVGTTYICGSNGKVIINDVWSPNVTVYPAQGVVSEINVHSSVQHQHRYVESLFPVNSKIFFVGNPYFGSEGIVLNPLLVYECGRLKVNITVLPEPDFTEAKNVHYKLESDYVNSYEASAIIGINSKSLGRITGTVLVIAGERRSNLVENITKTNIGLQFKFPKQNEQRVGYARRINNQWFYSSKAIALIHSYCKKFPMVIDYLSKSSDRNEFCFEADLFPENIGQNSIQDIVSWLKEQDHIKADRVISGSKTVNKEAIEEILESIEKLKSLPVKTVKLQVKPHLLLKPDVSLPYMYKSEKHIRLFDRVVIVRTTYMVPLGSKGTVVGIYPVSDPNPIRLECVKVIEHFFEVLFDKNLPNGNDIHGIAQGRVYKVPESSVLLIINQGSRQVDHMSNCTTGQNVKTTSYYTSNSKPAEEIDKYQSALHENLLTNKITNRGHEDFWMPSANTKVTYLDKPSLNNTFYEAVDRTSKDTKSPIQPTATLKNIEVPNEYQAKTEKLKNLLGLAENNPTTTHQSIKSEQMKVCKNLPKPPSNWRDKSKEYLTNDSNHNFGPSSFGNQQQESSVAQCSGSADVNSGHHNQMYKKNNTYYRQQNIFNLESLNQKGAFTPLHGSNYHTFQALSNSGNVQGIEQSIQNISLNEPSVSSDISTIQRLNVEATTKRSREETRKKAPRIPKIGAKFDHAH